MGKKAVTTGTMSAELGRQIAHAMIDAGVTTNTALAETVGLSKQTIGRILDGSKPTSADEYASIARALGKSFSELLVAAEEALERREEH